MTAAVAVCPISEHQAPLEEPCPKCQFPWLAKKGKKILCPRDECDYQAAAVAEAAE